MLPNFKALSIFLAVAENTSFRQAAEQVHLSLPAVSMQIKQLETRLGVSLFHRTTRKVVLTHEGEQLLISVRKALAEYFDNRQKEAALLALEARLTARLDAHSQHLSTGLQKILSLAEPI